MELRRYIDGGVRSPTNADRAAGYGRVLVISAMIDAEFEELLHQEASSLRAAGAKVLVLTLTRQRAAPSALTPLTWPTSMQR